MSKEALKLALEAWAADLEQGRQVWIPAATLREAAKALAKQPAQHWNAGVPPLYPKPEPGVSIKAEYEQPPQRKPLTDEQLDKAGMKLAECMDYPWKHMPEEGKRTMCDHAKAIIEAAYGIKEKNA